MTEGWIKNDGSGICPIPVGTKHEVMLVDGYRQVDNKPETWCWLGNSYDGNIEYYRILDGDLSSELAVNVVDTSTKSTNPKQIHGQANLPLSLFSPLGTAYGSLGKLNGKLKYGQNNFVATPVIASIYVDAIRRHLDKWMSGQECDSADGVPHFAAILANVDILICARAAGTLVDDRPMSINYFEEIERLTPMVKALQELHKDKNPHHYLLSEQHVTV